MSNSTAARCYLACGVEALIPEATASKSALHKAPKNSVMSSAPRHPAVAAKLLRAISAIAETAAQIEALEQQPIYTVYLQYPAHFTLPHPMLGLHRRYSQWLFDKGQIAGQHGLLAAVISAEGIHQELSQDELAQKVIAELREEFGFAAQPKWFKVIAEKRATFCCSPDLHRPPRNCPAPFAAGG